jgi:hypothetical protein
MGTGRGAGGVGDGAVEVKVAFLRYGFTEKASSLLATFPSVQACPTRISLVGL